MRSGRFCLVMILASVHALTADGTVSARVATLVINPREVTILHLRPEFESSIRMPEEVTSVILGSPSLFKAEHSEGEPEYVYVKPITKDAAQSNLLIATRSGEHVAIELISDGMGDGGTTTPVDFFIEYRKARSFLIPAGVAESIIPQAAESPNASQTRLLPHTPRLLLDAAFEQQSEHNVPHWTKWEGHEIETSIGEVWQARNETIVAYSLFNSSSKPVEIMPPQVQITGGKIARKRNKRDKGVLTEQMEIRDFHLSATRLEPGARADAVVVFDRPNFKQSSEQILLQIAQADQVDRPILIYLPFTPRATLNTDEGSSHE